MGNHGRQIVVVSKLEFFNHHGIIFINDRKTPLGELEETLKKIFQNRLDKQIFLRADEIVPYGFVVKTMAAIRNAGIEQLGMVTVPLEKGK